MDTVTRTNRHSSSSHAVVGSGGRANSRDSNIGSTVAEAVASLDRDPSNVSREDENGPEAEASELGSNMTSLQPPDQRNTTAAPQQQESGYFKSGVGKDEGNGKLSHFTRSRTPKPQGQTKDEDISEKVSD
jgi:hypothetical protein